MSNIDIRHLNLTDADRLMALEKKQWKKEQLPTKEQLVQRINRYPELCLGAFCQETGDVLASLFLKPVDAQQLSQASNWRECVEMIQPSEKEMSLKSLFGISFTSINALAADLLFAYGYGYFLKRGCQSIFLGSPIPGYKKAYEKEGLSVEDYVNRAHPFKESLPYDSQLRYYRKRGFRNVISIQKDYFPHEGSCNYGVILEGRVPLSRLSFLWRLLPESWIRTCCQKAVLFLNQHGKQSNRLNAKLAQI